MIFTRFILPNTSLVQSGNSDFLQALFRAETSSLCLSELYEIALYEIVLGSGSALIA